MRKQNATPIMAGQHPYWTDPPLLSCTYSKRECGCEVIGNGTLPHPLAVKFCPTHEAAPKLLEALKAIRDHTFVDAEGPELRAQNECNHRRACVAIAKAEDSATANDATPGDCCPYGCMDLPCEHFKRARP